ncbi:DDB1- and CUL4-associated factor 12 [Auxenochlorella protothecoides]|uniref:DDB1-and CUL4-associated factor 12 n=2 Tax=Auxenochlorella protothecoides TaxID=3075 RepID=A0A087SIR9_AUXPR|nr:DDB1- and CUL4-associated factor 12 [Auxenochlorella protothecoides]KFM25623.1 DDB1- and CUL4-associated factor 12 [Auxenochlorella protothecoides]
MPGGFSADPPSHAPRRRAGHRRWLQRDLLHRLPQTWSEREYVCKTLDKAFACAWEDGDHVLVGTKCNQLLRLDTLTGRSRAIPLPPAPPRARETFDHEWGHCGIHSIALSPARRLVATGGDNPADAVVLDRATWRPVATLVGHLDWVFGLAWLSDAHLVTASRDASDYGRHGDFRKSFGGKVRGVEYDAATRTLATLSLEGAVRLHDPGDNLRLIRRIDLKPRNAGEELVCLALTPSFAAAGRQTDVVLMDTRTRRGAMTIIPSPDATVIDLKPRNAGEELVCLALTPSFAAAGRQTDVVLMDTRTRRGAMTIIPSPDATVGVRSVSVQDDLVSFGTGAGKLCFFDVRAGKLLDRAARREAAVGQYHTPALLAPLPFALETGPGWLDQNQTYWDHFANTRVQHACYAHAWDPAAQRVFACGGPLAFGMRGCYMGLWR